VATTAAAAAAATGQQFNTIQERIGTLERGQYQTQGRSTGIGTSSDVIGRVITIALAVVVVAFVVMTYYTKR